MFITYVLAKQCLKGEMIQIEVDGVPIPWQRPAHRIMKSKGKNLIVVYDKQKKEKEMARWQIRAQFKEAKITTPLLVDITFRMPIQKSASKKIREQMLNGTIHHMKKPDCDNLEKFILDCMTGIVFEDDAQICTLYCRKVFSSIPGTLIRIKQFTMNNYTKDELQELEEDEHYSRDDGWGELHRDSSQQEGHSKASRKENHIIDFRDE